MLDKLVYENSRGEKVVFGEGGIFANYNDLRDYTWDFKESNGIISSFSRTTAQKSIPVWFVGSDCREKRNSVAAIFERDIYNKKKGKMIAGDYYLNCWIISASNSNYLDDGKLLTTFSIVTDDPYWRQDSLFSFVIGDNQVAPEEEYLDYPYDYPYDYTIAKRVRALVRNDSVSDADFELTIYGAVENPAVSIGTYTYRVNTDLLAGEYLKINSFDKTVIKTKNNGTEINVFDLRNRDSYIFQQIAVGNLNVIWDGNFGFDIVLHKKWSEPLWI